MQIHATSLLALLESALPAIPPMALTARGDRRLGHLIEGQEIQLQDAWNVLLHVDFTPDWRIVPLRNARIVLAHQSQLTADELSLADSWQQAVIGVLAALFEPEDSRAEA